jgi:hypothetical protein
MGTFILQHNKGRNTDEPVAYIELTPKGYHLMPMSSLRGPDYNSSSFFPTMEEAIQAISGPPELPVYYWKCGRTEQAKCLLLTQESEIEPLHCVRIGEDEDEVFFAAKEDLSKTPWEGLNILNEDYLGKGTQ